MRSGSVRGKLIHHAAPPPRRSGPQVHLLELRRRQAAERRAKLLLHPPQVLQRDALQQYTSAKAQGQLPQRDSPERRSLHMLPQRQALDAARGRSRRTRRMLRSNLPRCTPATLPPVRSPHAYGALRGVVHGFGAHAAELVSHSVATLTAGDGVADEGLGLEHSSITQRLAGRKVPRQAAPASSAATSTVHLPLCALYAPRTTPLRPFISGLACKPSMRTREPSRTAAAEGVGGLVMVEYVEGSLGGPADACAVAPRTAAEGPVLAFCVAACVLPLIGCEN
jgi:hypothetical protein